MKTCRVCGQSKNLNEFYSLSRNKDGKDTRCKVCVRDVQKDFYFQTRDLSKIRARNILVRYGLEVSEHYELTKDGCFVCGSMDNLCIDHDHECCPGKITCGKCIRGVLCWSHNLAEAAFKNVEQINKLLEYRSNYG